MSLYMSYFPKKSNRQLQIAITFGVLLVLWMLSGLLVERDFEQQGSDVSDAKTANIPSANMKYEAVEFQAKLKRRYAELQGETKAVRDVSLVAQINGKVAGILAKEGQKVQTGQPLLQLNLENKQEQLASLQALLQQKQLQYEVSQKLTQQGFESKLRLLRAKADLAQTQADLKQVALQIGFSTIKAPFDGFLEKINVKIGDFVTVGMPASAGAVARIVDINPILVQGSVGQNDRIFVAENQPTEIILPNGKKYQGKIHYLAHSADKSTRSFPVEISVDNANYEILSGLSATINIPLNEVKAHFIPSSALSLQDDGALQVKALNAQNKVTIHKIKLISEEDKGIWVEGLPENVVLITKGQAYATEGITINADKIEKLK